jgi:flagellar hook protein FlgE
MFESIYVGLTGLSSFSRNLTVIGNNVSNLNSAGFKNTQLSFSDLVYRNVFSDRGGGEGALMQFGSGVGIGGTRVLFTQGSLRQTGNPTDLAVDGNGFFVLRDGDKTVYTRGGEFEFNADGLLVSRANGARVAAFAGGGLQDLSIASLRTSPPQATTRVSLLDNLSSGDTTQDVNVTVFDASGGSQALTLAFTNNSGAVPRSWLFNVRDAAGNTISSGEVRFNGDGSPATGFNSHVFTLAPPGGVPPTQITLDFGPAGGFSGVTNFSAGADSTIRVGSQDGFAAGLLVSTAFDPAGAVVATYSNGKTARGQQIALAIFAAPQELEEAGGALFENRSGQPVVLGTPASGVFGKLAGGSVESANVDLAQQFSELIVTQRGYQASSQVITTANEMIEQLFQITGRR